MEQISDLNLRFNVQSKLMRMFLCAFALSIFFPTMLVCWPFMIAFFVLRTLFGSTAYTWLITMNLALEMIDQNRRDGQ